MSNDDQWRLHGVTFSLTRPAKELGREVDQRCAGAASIEGHSGSTPSVGVEAELGCSTHGDPEPAEVVLACRALRWPFVSSIMGRAYRGDLTYAE